jgi:hypothetical protein
MLFVIFLLLSTLFLPFSHAADFRSAWESEKTITKDDISHR